MKVKSDVSSKEIYLWNMLGNIAAAGSSVLYLLIITRLTDAQTADVFSLVNGIAAVWVVIGLFQVRTFQGTDVKAVYSFSNYKLARILSVGLMLVTILPYLYWIDYPLTDWTSIAVMLLFLLYRVCDALSDLYQGLFQQHERLDLAGKSMTYRYGLSVVTLALGLVLTKSIVLALGLLFLINIVFVLLYDVRLSPNFIRVKQKVTFKVGFTKAIEILKACFPLFLSGFLLALIFNEPKQAIAIGLNQGWIGEGAQRDYGILFMPAFFMSLFILILRPLITQLAVYWNKGEEIKFRQVSKKLFASLIFGGAGITILAALLGTPILSLIFGLELNAQWLSLTLIVAGGVFYSIAITFIDIMTIFRKQGYFIPVLVFIAILSKLITESLVRFNGLVGAGFSFLIVMLVFMLGNAMIYFIYVRRKKKYDI